MKINRLGIEQYQARIEQGHIHFTCSERDDLFKRSQFIPDQSLLEIYCGLLKNPDLIPKEYNIIPPPGCKEIKFIRDLSRRFA